MTSGNDTLRNPSKKAFALLFGVIFLYVCVSFLGSLSSPRSYPATSASRTSGPTSPAPLPPPANRQCIWEGVEKIIAIGDLHGDYEHFAEILTDEDINLAVEKDKKLHWIGGKTHLVQIGDVMDRGDDAKRIFDDIRILEKEAAQAGGMVHMLIGNHEEINITEQTFDYPDYLSVGQLKSFLRPEFIKKKEAEFAKQIGTNGNMDAEWKDLIETKDKDKNKDTRDEYFEFFNQYYGRWIAEEHNAVIKINDTVFVHGGISEKYSKMKLQDINNRYYTEFLKSFQGESFRTNILFDQNGPLWFRELATWGDPLFSRDVDKILANLGAKYIVIAHTPLIDPGGITSRFNSRVWVIDTGISRLYGGYLSALIIEKGKFVRWRKNYAP